MSRARREDLGGWQQGWNIAAYACNNHGDLQTKCICKLLHGHALASTLIRRKYLSRSRRTIAFWLIALENVKAYLVEYLSVCVFVMWRTWKHYCMCPFAFNVLSGFVLFIFDVNSCKRWQFVCIMQRRTLSSHLAASRMGKGNLANWRNIKCFLTPCV